MSLVTKLILIDDPDGISRFKKANFNLHDHLADDADWNTEFWKFDVEFLRTYSKQLEAMFTQSVNGIEFQVFWVGDKPNKTLILSLNEFLDIVRMNKIGNKTRYVVKKSA